MTNPSKCDILLRTEDNGSRGMWCEFCERSSVSTRTTVRVYTSGKEVMRETCSVCGKTQETEFFKGATTRIQADDNS